MSTPSKTEMIGPFNVTSRAITEFWMDATRWPIPEWFALSPEEQAAWPIGLRKGLFSGYADHGNGFYAVFRFYGDASVEGIGNNNGLLRVYAQLTGTSGTISVLALMQPIDCDDSVDHCLQWFATGHPLGTLYPGNDTEISSLSVQLDAGPHGYGDISVELEPINFIIHYRGGLSPTHYQFEAQTGFINLNNIINGFVHVNNFSSGEFFPPPGATYTVSCNDWGYVGNIGADGGKIYSFSALPKTGLNISGTASGCSVIYVFVNNKLVNRVGVNYSGGLTEGSWNVNLTANKIFVRMESNTVVLLTDTYFKNKQLSHFSDGLLTGGQTSTEIQQTSTPGLGFTSDDESHGGYKYVIADGDRFSRSAIRLAYSSMSPHTSATSLGVSGLYLYQLQQPVLFDKSNVSDVYMYVDIVESPTVRQAKRIVGVTGTPLKIAILRPEKTTPTNEMRVLIYTLEGNSVRVFNADFDDFSANSSVTFVEVASVTITGVLMRKDNSIVALDNVFGEVMLLSQDGSKGYYIRPYQDTKLVTIVDTGLLAVIKQMSSIGFLEDREV